MEFSCEDAPRFQECKVLPYYLENETGQITLYLRKDLTDPEAKPRCLGDYIEEREPSIIYTMARCLVAQSNNYIPTQDVSQMTETRGDVEFY